MANIQDKSKELASSVSRGASDVKEKAQDLGSAAMHQAKETASNLTEKARDAASSVGQRVSDFTNLIRRNPIPALLIGVAFGFLVARATTRRS
jgi:ElaB/YqjD/DUF883 family membrane-anchored ribosome-binding protein